MPRFPLAVTAAALLLAAMWHLPATAQHAAPAAPAPAAARPAAPVPEKITFDEYRDFRLRYVAARRAGLAAQLAAPGLAAGERARLAGIKAYYDRLWAMPAAERDRLFRARFDEIDTDHDGTLDTAERAQWRQKQRQYYAELAAARAKAGGPPP
jgi:hypothetical protein